MSNSFIGRTLSFRTKMIVVFFLITIIPFAFFAFYSHSRSVEGIIQANAMFSLDYAEQSASNMDQYLQSLKDQINEVIGNDTVQELLGGGGTMDEGDFVLEMLNFAYGKSVTVDAFRVRIFPIHPDSFPIYNDALGYARSPEETEWFRQAAGSVTPTWQLLRPGDNQNSVPLLAKFNRFTGLHDRIPRGVVETDLSDDQLRRFLSPSARVADNRIYLVNDEGEVLFDSKGYESRGRLLEEEELAEIAGREGSGSENRTLNGVQHLVTYTNLTQESWMIIGTTPLSSLTGSLAGVNRLFVVFLVVYALSSLGVVGYLTISFMNPVARLVQYMRRHKVDSVQALPRYVNRKDEIGWLYRGYGSMVARIEELIEEASRSERVKNELEFQVLSHQINPHFLYNTLEAVRWKAEAHHQTDISEMVANLGNLLRLSLNGGSEITTLGREIEQVNAYISIEQKRLGEPLRTMFLVDPALLELPFLRLLLQPLVENAIHHGVRNNPGKGKLVLSVAREADDLVLTLSDNGVGMSEDQIARCLEGEPVPSGKLRGVGVRNVNKRLQLSFGEAYRLTITSQPGEGTIVTLRHPVLHSAGDEGDGSRRS
ncbi:cache domain-containing sensor histidine kinase [Cohnella fermenti]|uniref:Sensor histidine kinase n=1 Tax=Cohnella fermenti TaxID=2565925 RepID=A0A4S4BQB5_9BACL|nr:sensor histidine kinase [Cohnella fermenti]THF77119.1 sensor histidine kinase [Cohnella fermenti]